MTSIDRHSRHDSAIVVDVRRSLPSLSVLIPPLPRRGSESPANAFEDDEGIDATTTACTHTPASAKLATPVAQRLHFRLPAANWPVARALVLALLGFPAVLAGGAFLPAFARVGAVVAISAAVGLACVPEALAMHHRSQLFSPAFSALSALSSLVPLLLWLGLFSSMPKFMTREWMPDVDTVSLPAADTALLGATAPALIDALGTWVAADVVAWLVYGVWHFVSAIVATVVLGVYGVMKHREHHPHVSRGQHLAAALTLARCFLVAFGSINFAGVMSQYVAPTAPPWYNDHYGAAVPVDALAVRGEPGGLARIDVLLGKPVYTTMFSKSPLVFGAFPSLHAAFATVIAAAFVDVWSCVRVRRTTVPTWPLAVCYVALVWWATFYLHHHYLVDVVCGSGLALGMYFGVVHGRVREFLATVRNEDAAYTPVLTNDIESAIALASTAAAAHYPRRRQSTPSHDGEEGRTSCDSAVASPTHSAFSVVIDL